MEDTNSRFINCTLIDALSLEPRGVHVSVENGEITDVSDSAIPDNSDTKTIDLRNKYLLPGLW
ncbi:MAG TPA: peptidase M38, partial [Dehalococcoidia bacterium]|nr:peptidase M38 [Dehalococcoidia bacterium]